MPRIINDYFANNNSYRKSFTLAETLITLGIIGIVVAMTLPSIITKYEKIKTVNQLKQTYTLLNHAIEVSISKEGDIKYWNFEQSNEGFYMQYIFPYLEKIGNKRKAVSSQKYTRPNGIVENNFTPVMDNHRLYTLANGITLSVDTEYKESSPRTKLCKSVGIDINGFKKPNKIGRDWFLLTIHKDYGLVPYGYKGCSDLDSYDEFDRTHLINAPRYGCSKNGGTVQNGAFCSALIISDGWEIKDDYPW